MDTNRIVKVYLKMRDKRTALKREYEEADGKLVADMEKLEAQLLKFLNENNMDNVKTPSGIFYKQADVIPQGSDWDAFYAWVKQEDAFDALERRIKKTFIKEYMEQHEGQIPPGVSVYTTYNVRVRRAS